MNPAIPVVVIGGVAYALTQMAPDGAAPPSRPPPPPTGGTYPGSTVGDLPKHLPAGTTKVITFSGSALARIKGAQVASQNPLMKSTTWAADVNIDPELQRKFDLIEAAVKKQFDNANEVAKAQAAETLNKELKLDPPLTGHEDWKTVAAVAGGAAGGALGAAIGGPIGAKLGALAGAYLGVKLEELIEKNWDELEAWVSDKWGDVKEFVEDAYDTVSGWLPF
jgi:hypothetical protein